MELLKYKDKINKMIDDANNVFIMGHRFLDLDALGSSIGVAEYLKSRNKTGCIIVNDTRLEKGVKKALDILKNSYKIVRSTNIKNKINSKSLLIIVDTNKEYLLQDKSLLQMFKNILVIDHHDTSSASLSDGLVIVDREASSTCEMLADLFDSENIVVDERVATLLLSGIVLDTNNFVIKTTIDTFRTSYLLTKMGANPQKVQYLLKQDLKNYVARQKVITNVKQINNCLITCAKSTILYRREDLARIADTLIQFDKIEASFVIGRLDKDHIGISARSLGIINVGSILEDFNGGGDENEAGASLENTSIKKVEEELIKIIKTLK